MTKTRVGLGNETQLDASAADPAAADTLYVASNPGVSAPQVGSATAADGEPARGDSIGRFVLLGVLGSGGMGNVYSAYDPHLDRKVAIKLLRGAVVAANAGDARTRLLREAQAMAKIDHPNVIKVHEVGMFGEQVYVAMEFAEGGTLRAWLAEPRARRDILDRFAQAGRGLAAAHAAGLVHRDFKPDNVLLAKDGTARVTDFGLVSAINAVPGRAISVPPPDVDLTVSGRSTPLSIDLTRTGSIMGTPTYMSPEQFEGGETTARTDQFSFCVALYEALYGTRPFAGDTYQILASHVLLGQIEPPPKGSDVPGWLRKVLLRGLAKDPAQRWPAMDDLLRALADDPAKRRRWWLAGGAAAVAIGGTATALVLHARHAPACEVRTQDLVLTPQRRGALEAAFAASKRPHAPVTVKTVEQLLDRWDAQWTTGFSDACTATRERSTQSEHLMDLRMQCLHRRLDDARATVDLLIAGGGDAVDHAIEAVQRLPTLAPCADPDALLAAVAPPETDAARTQVESVRRQLDPVRGENRLARYQTALAHVAPVVAAARATGYKPLIAESLVLEGDIQTSLSDHAAVDTLREALHVAAEAGDAPTELDAAGRLVFALTTLVQKYEVAAEVGDLAEATAVHARPPADIAVRLQDAIALLESTRGQQAQAQARYEKALALAKDKLGADHPATVTTINQLGNLAQAQGHFEQARTLLQQVVDAREKVVGKDHPDVAAGLNNLGLVYRTEGKLDDAQRVFERSLAIRIAALGPDHPDVGVSYNNLGNLWLDRGDRGKALELYEKALVIWEKAYGKDSVELATPLANIANVLEEGGDLPGARKDLERALALLEAAHGKEHPSVAGVLGQLGNVARDEGKLDEALADLQQGLAILQKVYGPDHPEVADALANIASTYKHEKKLDLAEQETKHALEVTIKAYGADHTRVAMSLTNLGGVQLARDENAAALESFTKARDLFATKLGNDHPYMSYALSGMGNALTELKRPKEAVPLLEHALAIREKAQLPPGLVAEVRYELAIALVGADKKRALAEGAKARDEYKQAGDGDDVKDVEGWLRKHR